MMQLQEAKPYSCKFPLREGSRIPAVKGWRTTKPNNFNYPQYGYALQPDEQVLDCDPKNYPLDPLTGKKVDVLAELLAQWQLPATKAVITPSGGYHLYYLKDPEVNVCFKQPEWPGIDFLSYGRLIAGEGSTAAAAGGGIRPYQAVNALEPAYLPPEFLASLKLVTEVTGGAAVDMGESDDSDENVNNYKIWLNTATPGTKGSLSDSIFKAACRGRDLGISLELTIECIADVYNPRCRPPAAECEIDKIANNAYLFAKGAKGAKNINHLTLVDPLLNAVAPAISAKTQQADKIIEMRNRSLASEFVLDGKDALLPNHVGNARLILKFSRDYGDLFWYDSFADKIKYNKTPWWRKDSSDELTDSDLRHIWDWLVGKGKYPKCSKEVLLDAIQMLASIDTRNPLQDELNGLVWDGVKRLDTYLIDTCRAIDDRHGWSRLVGRKFLIGAVARAFKPGEKMDNILILQGDQGLRKSAWVSALGGKWAATGTLNVEDKDIHLKMLGAWIMELPEINQSLSKRDLNAIKGFVTEPSSRFRKPYGRVVETVPRTTVFIGSINATMTGYLKDPTGDRRYWPVNVDRCNPELLTEIREQLIAEAVAAYRAGESWWLTEDQEKLARAHQDAVRENEPWIELLAPKIQALETLQTEDAYHLLGVPINQVNESSRRRVYTALTAIGYKYSRSTMGWTKI